MVFINVFLICLSLYILGKAVKEWREIVLITISFFQNMFYKEEKEEDEEWEMEGRPKYDVHAFTNRMAELRKSMDEEGLFDYPIPEKKTDMTGTEIITDAYESEIENIRR